MKWYLDFGHGGKDPGAIGPTNLKESDIALKIGMMVKEKLENAFEKVITTRDNDKYYSLDYRTKKANNENSDYFISIHLNSASNPSAKGREVWLYDENSKLQTLANNLCNNLATKMNTPNRGVKYSKKYAAHDELNQAKVGDTVKIRMTRPLSKTKRYELVEVLTKAVIL